MALARAVDCFEDVDAIPGSGRLRPGGDSYSCQPHISGGKSKGAHISSTTPPPQSHHPDSKSRRSKHHPRSRAPYKNQTPDSQRSPSSAISRMGMWHPLVRGCTRCSMETGTSRRHGCSRRGDIRGMFVHTGRAAAVDQLKRGGLRLSRGQAKGGR